MTAPRTLPTPDADSEPFWAACRDGHLSAQQCPECSRFRWPPMEFCPWCHHHGGDWTVLPGTGIVQSFVVVHRAFDPAFEDRIPYVVAHIALDGAADVTIIGNVVADTTEAVFCGQRVSVEFVNVGSVTLPQFRPS
jgi:uncharacterized OB-fold protein